MKLLMPSLLGILSFTACSMATSSGNVPARDPAPSQQREQKITRVSGSLNQGTAPTFKGSSMNLKGRENLRAVNFTDAKHGWVGGGKGLYKTDDGGVNWQQVKIEVPQGAGIEKVLFANATSGWVILQKSTPFVVNYKENHFWLMHTTDGGQSWQLQHEEKEAKATHIAQASEQVAWLTGIKYLGLSPARFTYLILRTTDQGEHWADVAEGARRFTAKQENISPDEVNDAIMGLIPSDASSAKAISGRMAIFNTSDGGNNWQQLGTLKGEPDQTSIRSFGIKEGQHVWVGGGADSQEGIWGMLAVEQSDRIPGHDTN